MYLELSDEQDTDLLKKIPTDWAVDKVHDPLSAQTLTHNKCYYVGIVLFGEECGWLCEPEITDNLFSLDHIKWIAVLHQTALENKKIRQLISRYFYDYLHYPVNHGRLAMVLGHAYGKMQLERLVIKERIASEQLITEDGLIGNSTAITNVRHNIKKIARVDAPVLITGESGTGKELAANLIHHSSQRTAGPFVAVNCAALPANLVQSELFGHEKGSFTGAYRQKIGRIEAANMGTIFLDEIGDLPLDMQITLLRFLEEHTIERVGGLESIQLDVRVIAATNVNLHRAIEQNGFREDLFYRLKVLNLHMPSLRHCGQDLEILAKHFINKFRASKRSRIKELSYSAIQVMYSYPWPGNVRELMNDIRAALVMSEGQLILPKDLGLERRAMRRCARTLEETREIAEKGAILNALESTGCNITSAAKYLSISRGTLYRLMEKYGRDCPGKAVTDEHQSLDEDVQ